MRFLTNEDVTKNSVARLPSPPSPSKDTCNKSVRARGLTYFIFSARPTDLAGSVSTTHFPSTRNSGSLCCYCSILCRFLLLGHAVFNLEVSLWGFCHTCEPGQIFFSRAHREKDLTCSFCPAKSRCETLLQLLQTVKPPFCSLE